MKKQGKNRAFPDVELRCDKPIVLIGMMGVGKTTVGRRLARRLGLEFRDADEEIQKAAGMSVGDLFIQHGEESFRKGEAQVIARLLSEPPHVLATGGGAVLHAETRRRLKEKAVTIWLRAEIDVLAKRATRRDTRPLLKNDDPRGTIERLMQERTAYYAEATVIVESQPGPHARTVEAIVKAIEPYMSAPPPDEKP